MKDLILESVIIGVITSILGNLIFKILVKINNIENNDMIDEVLDKYKKNYFLQVVLFFTGVFIHLLLEYVGLDKWYCEKKCIADKCKLVCEKQLN